MRFGLPAAGRPALREVSHRRDLVARIGGFKVASDNDRGGPAGGRELSCQRRHAFLAPRDQCHTMTVRCENTRQLGAYPRLGTGNQRHTLGHDQCS